MSGSRLMKALTQNRAATDATADDRRLLGRTYAVPFERVWQAALALARARRGWTMLEADDLAGLIRAEARTPLGFVDDVAIHVRLDPDAQTRVDMVSASRKGKADLGKNARRIGKFMGALDRRLGRR